jgi:hypothetical protein
MCDYIYPDNTQCNEQPISSRCKFHNHIIFNNRNIKEILKNGLGDDYDEIVDWIRFHPENIEDGSPIEQDYYGCGTNYSSTFIILTYLQSLDKDGKPCIIPYEGGKWKETT